MLVSKQCRQPAAMVVLQVGRRARGLTTPHEENEWCGSYKLLHRDSDRALVNAAMSLRTPKRM